MPTISRRGVMVGAASFAIACNIEPAGAAKKKHAAGSTEWVPERSTEGPVVIIVSVPEQRVRVYRNGIEIGHAPVSTGKKGHETPVGVFTILQKDEDHRSSLYKEAGGEEGASMPFMERLTWDGIALHAGNVPGYPASHGCVRLPLEFAKKLYTVTQIGTPVIVADDHSEPQEIVHSGLILPSSAVAEAVAAASKAGKRKLSFHHQTGDHAPAALVVSYEDKAAYLFESGQVVLEQPLKGLKGRGPKSDQVFVLHAIKGTERISWFAVGYNQKKAEVELERPEPKILEDIDLGEEARRRVAEAMHPGFTLVVTRQSAHSGTRTAKGFTIARHE